MEHINQLNEWMRQLTNSSQSNYADIAVAKRLLSHSIEAHEKIKQLQAQLEFEEVSHAAWEKQSLLEYSELMQERDALLVAAERVLRTKRGEDDWLILAIDCVRLEEVIAKLKEE